jgi:hypothetical protein
VYFYGTPVADLNIPRSPVERSSDVLQRNLNDMTCRQCGTEIAANALICFRCGCATAAPRVRPPAAQPIFAAPRRGRLPTVIGLALVVVTVALWFLLG